MKPKAQIFSRGLKRPKPMDGGVAIKPKAHIPGVTRPNPVAAGLAPVKQAWEKYQADREHDTNAVYVYLQAVFDLVQRWKKEGVAQEYSLKALKEDEAPIRMKPDPFARVIYCTADLLVGPETRSKTRSKWARLLQIVENWNQDGKPLAKFIGSHGGINECIKAHSIRPRPRSHKGSR